MEAEKQSEENTSVPQPQSETEEKKSPEVQANVAGGTIDGESEAKGQDQPAADAVPTAPQVAESEPKAEPSGDPSSKISYEYVESTVVSTAPTAFVVPAQSNDPPAADPVVPQPPVEIPESHAGSDQPANPVPLEEVKAKSVASIPASAMAPAASQAPPMPQQQAQSVAVAAKEKVRTSAVRVVGFHEILKYARLHANPTSRLLGIDMEDKRREANVTFLSLRQFG